MQDFFKLRFSLNRSKNLTGTFHVFIIASFFLGLGGCGYKAAPYYQEKVPKSDKNVKFILKKREFPNMENNVSCK